MGATKLVWKLLRFLDLGGETGGRVFNKIGSDLSGITIEIEDFDC